MTKYKYEGKGTLLLRGLDAGTKHEFKVTCARLGLSMREAIEKLMREANHNQQLLTTNEENSKN